jgi:acetyl esterase/lipase
MRRTPRASALLALLAAVAVFAGCTIPPPPGAAPLRYRDTVFANFSVTRDIQYGSAPDNSGNPVALKLDLYQPTGDTQTQRPAVAWVHGGGFSGGDKSAGPSPDLAGRFAKLGYVTVSINYRLLAPSGCNGGSLNTDCIVAALGAQHDAQAAVRWLRANAATYKIDPTRIGIGGESAGAITSALVGVNSQDPGSSGNPGYPSTVGGWMSLSGGLPGGGGSSSGDAPGLLFHGTADGIVPYQWSVDTQAALFRAGVPVFLETFEGAGHVPYLQFRDLIFQQSDYFFYNFLDLAHAAGQPASAARAFDRQAARLKKQYPRFAHGLRESRRRAGRR